jgi:hypothetical protein
MEGGPDGRRAHGQPVGCLLFGRALRYPWIELASFRLLGFVGGGHRLVGRPAYLRHLADCSLHLSEFKLRYYRETDRVDLLRRVACMDISDGVTLGQEVRVVVAYIEARPELMHEPFRMLALEVLRSAWPCR